MKLPKISGKEATKALVVASWFIILWLTLSVYGTNRMMHGFQLGIGVGADKCKQVNLKKTILPYGD